MKNFLKTALLTGAIYLTGGINSARADIDWDYWGTVGLADAMGAAQTLTFITETTSGTIWSTPASTGAGVVITIAGAAATSLSNAGVNPAYGDPCNYLGIGPSPWGLPASPQPWSHTDWSYNRDNPLDGSGHLHNDLFTRFCELNHKDKAKRNSFADMVFGEMVGSQDLGRSKKRKLKRNLRKAVNFGEEYGVKFSKSSYDEQLKQVLNIFPENIDRKYLMSEFDAISKFKTPRGERWRRIRDFEKRTMSQIEVGTPDYNRIGIFFSVWRHSNAFYQWHLIDKPDSCQDDFKNCIVKWVNPNPPPFNPKGFSQP